MKFACKLGGIQYKCLHPSSNLLLLIKTRMMAVWCDFRSLFQRYQQTIIPKVIKGAPSHLVHRVTTGKRSSRLVNCILGPIRSFIVLHMLQASVPILAVSAERSILVAGWPVECKMQRLLFAPGFHSRLFILL